MQAALRFPDISPEIFTVPLFGAEFALRWYALSYIVGILLAWRLVLLALQRPALWSDGARPMTRLQADDLMTWIILGVILGGRLGFVIFYQPAYFLANPGQILFLWQGGMSFHGGFLGVVLALILFCRRNRIPFLGCTDVIAWTVPVPIFFVRIANFINAELWGRPTELPWGVIFPGLSAQSCANVGEFCARHPSQIYEAMLEGLVLGLVLAWLVWRRHALRFPGLVTGAFLAGYGLARCLVEFVRQPDAQFVSPGNPLGLAFHIDGYGLTMGQTLSLPMIAVGVFLIWRSRRPRTGEAAA